MDIYGHVIPGKDEEAAVIMDRAFNYISSEQE